MSKAQREVFESGNLYRANLEHVNPDEEATKDEALRRHPDSPAKCVREIVVEWLKENGYEGLRFVPELSNPCQCVLPNIFHCGDSMGLWICVMHGACRPGVLKDGKIVRREE